jgi:serine/threonine-protein kinase
MSLDNIIADLLMRWQKDPYLTLGPEELCREYKDHPRHAELLAAVRQRIRDLQAAGDSTTEEAATPLAPGRSAPQPLTWTAPGLRYRPMSFHARGGLGEVFRAEDEELHREVALKRIQERYHDHAESCRRFLQEAEITARLQHPGVVPVHGLVRDADGQPCYAMRFIEGGTLDDAVKRYHAADHQPGRDPGERRLALRELLGRFIAVCNTVAYAHSRGILHRDLKPGNVMLGNYGETLVVDWGLAKSFERTEAERSTGEDSLAPARGGTDEGSTEVGRALGTPSYMSPEQAEGQWDVVGPASDIFSLGATLYAVLTGQAPYRGSSNYEVLNRARLCDFPPPRQVKPEVPRALEAVCLKAMAREPQGRYATALGLAADVEHWLADEPVSAYREPWAARAGRYLRRHRTLAAGVTTGLVLTVVGLSAAMITLSAANRREQKALDVAKEELALLNNFYSEIGDVGKGRTTLAAFQNTVNSTDRLVKEHPERTEYQRLLVQGYFNLGALHRDARRLDDAEASYQTALKLAVQFRDAFPDAAEPRRLEAAAYDNLGGLYHARGRHGLAEQRYKEALRIRETLAESGAVEARAAVASTKYSLGMVLADLDGRSDEARAAYQQAITTLDAAVKENPEVLSWQAELAHAHYNLGVLQRDTGRDSEAEAACEAALALQKSLVAHAPDTPEYEEGLALTLNVLGKLAFAAKPEEALRRYLEARDTFRRLAATYPELLEYQSELAYSENNVGVARQELKQFSEATKACEEAIAIQRKLVAAAPGVTVYRADLATFYNNLGADFIDDGKTDAAEGFLLDALAIQERLVREHPDVADFGISLGGGYRNFAMRMRGDVKPAAMLAWMDHSMAVLEDVHRRAPARREAADALAAARQARGRLAALGVRLWLRLPPESRDEVPDWDRALALYKGPDRGFLRCQRAVALARRGNHAEAVAEAAALARGDSVTGELLLGLARAYAAAASSAGTDKKLSTDVRKKLSGRYADEALALLLKAQKAGWFDVPERRDDLRIDVTIDFKPLAQRAEFQKLLVKP